MVLDPRAAVESAWSVALSVAIQLHAGDLGSWSEAWPCAEQDEITELSGGRAREPGPWKSVGVEEEHEIVASAARTLVERASLAGPTPRPRRAGCGGAGGGLGVHDDHVGEVRIAGERREASGDAPLFISSRCNRADRLLRIGARRRERGALPASSYEPARAHERRGEPVVAKDHLAASARGG